MDQNTAEQIAQFFDKWGLAQALAIILIMTITWFVKLPIYHAGQKYAEKYGVDKSAVTWCIGLIPFVLGFVAALVIALWGNGWDAKTLEWSGIVKQSGTLAAGAMGAYEFVKVLFKGAQASKEKSAAKAAVEAQKEKAAATVATGSTGTAVAVVETPKAEAKPAEIKAQVAEAKIAEAKAISVVADTADKNMVKLR